MLAWITKKLTGFNMTYVTIGLAFLLLAGGLAFTIYLQNKSLEKSIAIQATQKITIDLQSTIIENQKALMAMEKNLSKIDLEAVSRIVEARAQSEVTLAKDIAEIKRLSRQWSADYAKTCPPPPSILYSIGIMQPDGSVSPSNSGSTSSQTPTK